MDAAEAQPFEVKVFTVLKGHCAYAKTSPFVKADKPFKGVFGLRVYFLRGFLLFSAVFWRDVGPPSATDALDGALKSFVGGSITAAAGLACQGNDFVRGFNEINCPKGALFMLAPRRSKMR